MSESIERAALVEIVDTAASEGCAASTREKLLAVAETTGAVAVGWFHCDGIGCPTRQARRRSQPFQTAFDRAMAERFGRAWDDGARQPFEPFVVTVTDAVRWEGKQP